MTLDELLALIPEDDRRLPLTVLDPVSGYCFEVVHAEATEDEYISPEPPPPADMSEATRGPARQVLLHFRAMPDADVAVVRGAEPTLSDSVARREGLLAEATEALRAARAEGLLPPVWELYEGSHGAAPLSNRERHEFVEWIWRACAMHLAEVVRTATDTAQNTEGLGADMLRVLLKFRERDLDELARKVNELEARSASLIEIVDEMPKRAEEWANAAQAEKGVWLSGHYDGRCAATREWAGRLHDAKEGRSR